MNGTLITEQHRYAGQAEFGETGIIFTGVVVPFEREVVGLPTRTIFFPYAQVKRFVFEEEVDDIDKLFGGSE